MGRFGVILGACLLLSACMAAGDRQGSIGFYDLVIEGGRVIDPETGLDAVRNVGVKDGRIVVVSLSPLSGRDRIDATGRVVAPGFIDLHSHAQTTPSMWMQAFDGVTTALDLEAGNLPISAAYDAAASEGRPIHYGFSVSWALARMKVLDGVKLTGRNGVYQENVGRTGWRSLISRDRIPAILAEVEQGLTEGGLGIGILLGYSPSSNREEFLELHRLAARWKVPTFTHLRHVNYLEPGGSFEGVAELIGVAAATGAHAHICHINSSSWRHIEAVGAMIVSARQSGVKVSTEAYPYGAGSTTISSPRYAPENLPLAGIRSTDIYMTDTGRWIGSDEELSAMRAQRPGAIGVFHFLNEEKPEDARLLEAAVLLPGAIIASDALPYTSQGHLIEGGVWPLPSDADAHPRVAGTFSRVMGRWVRERKVLTLNEAIAKSTLLPANILVEVAPQMRAKGRIQPGADADIIVFDPDTIRDQATYEAPAQPSIGVDHVIVAGVAIIRDGQRRPGVLPGRPVRGTVRAPISEVVSTPSEGFVGAVAKRL